MALHVLFRLGKPAQTGGYKGLLAFWAGGAAQGSEVVVTPPEPTPQRPADGGGAGAPVRRHGLSVRQAYGPAFPNLVRKQVERLDPAIAQALAAEAEALAREAEALAAERNAERLEALTKVLEAKLEAFEAVRDAHLATLKEQQQQQLEADEYAAILLLLN